MYTQRDLKLFNDAIKKLEEDNDQFYLKQLENLEDQSFDYDYLIKLVACFYTQKYRLSKEKNNQQKESNDNVVVIHPAYKSGVTPELVLDTYKRCGFNKCETARVLGISIKTVYNRLRECGVQ